MVRIRSFGTHAALAAAVALALAACTGKPPVAPTQPACVVGQASVNECVLR